MADLASFSLSDRRAAPHSRAHQYRLTAVSATWRGQTAGHAGGREGGAGRGRAGEGRAGQGRGGDCPHFPQTRTFVTAEPSRPVSILFLETFHIHISIYLCTTFIHFYRFLYHFVLLC